MKDIMKMTLYECKKNSILRSTYLAIFVSIIILLFFQHSMQPDQTIFDVFSVDGTFLLLTLYVGMGTAVVVSMTIAGNDFADKTMNYDLMFGHSRKQVYFGRIIPSLLLGEVLSTATLVIPYLLLLFVKEPGPGVNWWGILVRVLLLELVYFRMSCEGIFVLFLIKRADLAGMIYLGVVVGVEFLLEMTTHFANIYLFGMSNMVEMVDWIAKMNYRLDGISIKIYQYMPTGEVIGNTVLYSVVISALCIFMGYVSFARDDMN